MALNLLHKCVVVGIYVLFSPKPPSPPPTSPLLSELDYFLDISPNNSADCLKTSYSVDRWILSTESN